MKKHAVSAADLADRLSLPAQALGELKLTVTGDRQVLVENHRGLELVTQELIELKWNKGRLRLYGTGLLIAAASKAQLLVSGKLERIEWE